MKQTYDITGVLPDGMMTKLSAGTNMLISGPAAIGKQTLAIRLLAAGHEEGEGILCVTTSRNAASLLDDFETQMPTLDRERVGIVDCSGSDHQRAITEIATEQVSSPGDLTGISISTAKLVERFLDRDISGIRHGLVSISTLIQYLDIDTAFKFIHIYTTRINDMNGLGIFTVDNVSHDPQELNTIMNEFDGIIELRETETGDREIRIKGLADISREWHPYS